MWQWFTYSDYGEDGTALEKGLSTSRLRTRAAGEAGGGGSDSGESDRDVGPTYEKLDPAVTAAILTQVNGRET